MDPTLSAGESHDVWQPNVTATAGGTVSSADGQATVTFAPGAVSATSE